MRSCVLLHKIIEWFKQEWSNPLLGVKLSGGQNKNLKETGSRGEKKTCGVSREVSVGRRKVRYDGTLWNKDHMFFTLKKETLGSTWRVNVYEKKNMTI